MRARHIDEAHIRVSSRIRCGLQNPNTNEEHVKKPTSQEPRRRGGGGGGGDHKNPNNSQQQEEGIGDMVVKKSPAAGARRQRRRCDVSVAITRLDGLPPTWPEMAAAAAVKVKWRWPATGALPELLMGRRWGRGVTTVERSVAGDGTVRWDPGEANRFRFEVVASGAVPDPNGGSDWDVSFSVLYGFQGQGRGKDLVRLEEIGTAMISLEEFFLAMQEKVAVGEKETAANAQQLQLQQQPVVVREKQVPITLRKDGWARNATLYVNIDIVDLHPTTEIRRTLSVRDTPRIDRTMTTTTMQEHRESYDSSAFHEVLDLNQLLELADKEEKVVVYRNKRNSDSSSSSISSVSTSGRASPEAAGSTSKRRFLPWRRRSKEFDKKSNESFSQELPKKSMDDDPIGSWETREFISRDAGTKLKAQVFFASIDQRDESAGGESACTALVAVLANALHTNRLAMPTRSEFDALIREGSSEWRKLCDNAAYMERFPNKHFDLETILAAKIRPISVLQEKAFVGFFRPESFESLSGAMSFDDIWHEISSSSSGEHHGEGHAEVYIVSWNDHFFVIKVEKDAYYIIDTLGERLFEGCTKAYMLKFDDASEMYALPEKTGGGNGGEKEQVIATGKECCREFINRFLAAIPLREELEIEKNGGGAAAAAPHQRLQIEFHFTVLQGDDERTKLYRIGTHHAL